MYRFVAGMIAFYVDTSVFGGTQDREFKESSLLFFQAVHEGNYQVLISSAVLDELKGAPKSVQDILTSLPERWLELLVEDARAKALANAYLQAGILTKKVTIQVERTFFQKIWPSAHFFLDILFP